MAIEIRELVIRAVVVEDAEDKVPEQSSAQSQPDPQLLIEECIRQVLKILKRSGER
jgi:hypothetical protein